MVETISTWPKDMGPSIKETWGTIILIDMFHFFSEISVVVKTLKKYWNFEKHEDSLWWASIISTLKLGILRLYSALPFVLILSLFINLFLFTIIWLGNHKRIDINLIIIMTIKLISVFFFFFYFVFLKSITFIPYAFTIWFNLSSIIIWYLYYRFVCMYTCVYVYLGLLVVSFDCIWRMNESYSK